MDTSDFISPSTLPKIPPTLNGVNTTSLVARWLLDGTLTDQVSGLTLTRAGTWNTTSYNRIWDFDIQQYVHAFTGANYYTFTPTGFPSGAAAGTIMCWAKFRATDGGVTFGYGSEVSLSARSLLHVSSSGSFSPYGTATSSGISQLSDGLWHHMAGVYNGSTLLLFIDGVLQGTRSDTLTTTLSSGWIGYWSAVSPGYMVGYITDCRCYSVALSSGQILAITKFQA